MLKNELKRDFKDMFHCKEFFFALTLSLAIIFIPLIVNLTTVYKADITTIYPASDYWGTGGMILKSHGDVNPFNYAFWNMLFIGILFPFISSFAYSFHYFDDRSHGIANIILPRTGEKAYYTAQLITSFVSGFLVIFLPLILEQLVLLISCPATSSFNILRNGVIGDNVMSVKYNYTQNGFSIFQMNHPYISNFIYSLVPALGGAFMAALSFCISFFVKNSKGRFLVLTLPGILWLVGGFAKDYFVRTGNQMEETIFMMYPVGNILYFLVFALLLTIVCVILLTVHGVTQKDESI
ncbi:MAG: hypothetical protein LKE53_05615 [Oscillospiraceae bacterium]|jgi:hypothetical protein|nr:hypothetical protein [Oscillospiraceae bacterium]